MNKLQTAHQASDHIFTRETVPKRIQQTWRLRAEYWGSSQSFPCGPAGKYSSHTWRGPSDPDPDTGRSALQLSFTHTFACGCFHAITEVRDGKGLPMWHKHDKDGCTAPTDLRALFQHVCTLNPGSHPGGRCSSPGERPKPSPLKNKSIYSEHCDFKQQNKICHSDQGWRCPRRCNQPYVDIPQGTDGGRPQGQKEVPSWHWRQTPT